MKELKIFVYKCLTAAIIFFVLFQLTIGISMNQIEKKINLLTSEENIFKVKNKIRKELETAIKKDSYFNDEDALLIKKFLNKIKSELENMLIREKRMEIFKKCLTFLDTRVELDQKGFKEDIFEH